MSGVKKILPEIREFHTDLEKALKEVLRWLKN
jgi:hypothetical protein